MRELALLVRTATTLLQEALYCAVKIGSARLLEQIQFQE